MRAGTAKIDITPTSNVWMDGMIRTHRSTGVHDPLFARALALTDNEDRSNIFVVVSVDVCALHEKDVDFVRQAVDRIGIPSNCIIIAATHTHSGPATVGLFNPLEKDYVQELLGKLVAVIEQAANNMRSVAAGCASGRENTISHYRRLLANDGHVVMNWEPYPAEHIVGPLGIIDPEVGVLKVVDAKNQDDTICLLFNHAGHPNVMPGNNYLLSAEYPGLSERLLEKEFGGTAIFVNGALGTMDIDGLKDRDWEGMERVGGALAEAVAKAAQTIVPSKMAIIRGANIKYTVPSRKITDKEWAWAENVLRQTGGAIQASADGVGDDYKALLYKKLREAQYYDIAIEQVCFAIDESAFISFPGELFTEIGMRIKAESSFRYTYIIGLANGRIGYIPTRKAIGEGGYEVDTRCVDDNAEGIIMEQSLSLLKEVHNRMIG